MKIPPTPVSNIIYFSQRSLRFSGVETQGTQWITSQTKGIEAVYHTIMDGGTLLKSRLTPQTLSEVFSIKQFAGKFSAKTESCRFKDETGRQFEFYIKRRSDNSEYRVLAMQPKRSLWQKCFGSAIQPVKLELVEIKALPHDMVTIKACGGPLKADFSLSNTACTERYPSPKLLDEVRELMFHIEGFMRKLKK